MLRSYEYTKHWPNVLITIHFSIKFSDVSIAPVNKILEIDVYNYINTTRYIIAERIKFRSGDAGARTRLYRRVAATGRLSSQGTTRASRKHTPVRHTRNAALTFRTIKLVFSLNDFLTVKYLNLINCSIIIVICYKPEINNLLYLI